MDEGHGGTIVPPRDGDPDGELLAQVIPLRRREREPSAREILADEPAVPLDGPETPPPSVERSVWDQPIVELRRRAPDGSRSTGGAPAAVTPVRVRRVLARLLAGAAAAAAAGAIAIIGGFAHGGAAGRPASTAPQKYAESRLGPRPGVAGLGARASSRSHRSATAHQPTHRRRAAAPTAGAPRAVSRSAAPSLTAGSRTPIQEVATTDSTPSSSSPQPVVQSAPAANYTPISRPSAESASVNREFGFER
jgi:hypothetical protein